MLHYLLTPDQSSTMPLPHLFIGKKSRSVTVGVCFPRPDTLLAMGNIQRMMGGPWEKEKEEPIPRSSTAVMAVV